MLNELTLRLVISAAVDGYVDNLRKSAKQTEELNQGLKEQKPAAEAASGGLSGLTTRLLALGTAYLSLKSAKDFLSDVVRTVGATQQLNTRFKGLTSSTAAYNETLRYLSETSNRLNTDVDVFSESYSKLLTLQQSGILTTSQARDVTEGYAQAAAKSGASATQLEQSMYGLTQGLSAGVLRAEELNQMTEPLPGLMQQLDKAVGGSAGAFRKMVNDGQVDAETLKSALFTALKSYEGAAEATSGNIIPTFTRLTNAYKTFKNELDKPVTAFIVPVLLHAQKIIQDFTKYVKENKEELTEMATVASQRFIVFMDVVRGVAVWLLQLAQSIVSFIANNQNLVIALLGVYAAFVLIHKIMMAILLIKLGMMVYQFLGLGTAITAVAAGLKAALLAATGASTGFAALAVVIKAVTGALLGFLATPVGIAVGALVIGFIALSAAIDSSNESLEESRKRTRENMETLTMFRDSINKVREVGKVGEPLVKEIERVRAALYNGRITKDAAQALVDGYLKAVRDRVEQEEALETKITAKVKALAEMRKQQLIQSLQEAQKSQQKNLDDALKAEESYTQKIEDLRRKLAEDSMSHEDKLRELRRRRMSDARQQADIERQINEKLAASRKALAEGDEEAAGARAEEAAQLAASLENNSKAVKYYEDSAKAIQDAKKAEIDATKNAQEENRSNIEKYRDDLAYVQEELDKLGVERKTIVKADITEAQSELNKLKQQLDELKNTVITPKVTVPAAGGSSSAQGFNKGGQLPGYSPTTDTIPARTLGGHNLMLAGGEYIVNAMRTRMMSPLLNFLNFAPLGNVQRMISGLQQQPVLKYASGGPLPSAPAASPNNGPPNMTQLNWSVGRQRGTLLAEENSLRPFLQAVERELQGT